MRVAGRPSPVAVFGILTLFFGTRLPLLRVRAPFFDELFTQWITRKPFGEILTALQSDSGPPLYYFVVRAFGVEGRLLSLLFATIALVALLIDRRFMAAALLAVFPPAVLFSVDARAYAMCAMFVTFGVLAIDRRRPYAAALFFVLAAYSHYYGVLFFPLLLLHGAAVRDRLKPVILAFVLFLPGFWLALHQPREAMAWMARFTYPDVLWARPPILLAALALILMIASAWPLNRFAWMTIVPSLLVLPIYVPLRFESVIATPLSLWMGSSSRRVFVGLLIAVFLAMTVMGIYEHHLRPVDDYRAAAEQVVSFDEPVVASGYLYLETIVRRPAIAFPAEQAQHPGWRATATSGRGLPPGTFIWIGERGAPELSIIQRTRRIEPLYVNARAMIARVR